MASKSTRIPGHKYVGGLHPYNETAIGQTLLDLAKAGTAGAEDYRWAAEHLGDEHADATRIVGILKVARQALGAGHPWHLDFSRMINTLVNRLPAEVDPSRTRWRDEVTQQRQLQAAQKREQGGRD